MSFRFATAFGAAALFLALSAGIGRAHEGHDHGPQPALAPANVAPRGEAASQEFELVAVAQGAELVIYLDRFATNEPVAGATIEVETPEGPKTATADGEAYRLEAPWLAKPGHLDLIFTVTAGGSVDVLPLSIDIPNPPDALASAAAPSFWTEPLKALKQPVVLLAAGLGLVAGLVLMSLRRRRRVAAVVLAGALALFGESGLAHEGQTHTESKPAAPTTLGADNERASRGADGAVFVPKPIQRIFGLRTALVETGTHPPLDRTARPHHPRSQRQRLSCRPRSAAGCRRRRAAFRGSARRSSRATCSPMSRRRCRRSTSPTCASGRANSISRSRSCERRLARYEQLVAERRGRARRSSRKPGSSCEGLRERRASLDKVRREPEALIAPVSGVIADGTPVAGQIAQPNAVIFHIVDPGTAVGRGAELRGARRRATALRAGPATASTLTLALPRLRLRRPQPVDPGAFRDRRRRRRLARRAVRHRAGRDRTRRRKGIAVPRSSARAQRQRPGLRLRARHRRALRAAAGAHRAARRRARADRGGHRARQAHRRCRAPNCSITCAEEADRCSPSSSPNRCATACWCWRSALRADRLRRCSASRACRSTCFPTSTGRPSPS